MHRKTDIIATIIVTIKTKTTEIIYRKIGDGDNCNYFAQKLRLKVALILITKTKLKTASVVGAPFHNNRTVDTVSAYSNFGPIQEPNLL